MTELVANPLSAGTEQAVSFGRKLAFKAVISFGLAFQIAWLAGAGIGLYALADVATRAITGHSL